MLTGKMIKDESKWRILRFFFFFVPYYYRFLITSLSDLEQRVVFYCCHLLNALLEIYFQKYMGAVQ